MVSAQETPFSFRKNHPPFAQMDDYGFISSTRFKIQRAGPGNRTVSGKVNFF